MIKNFLFDIGNVLMNFKPSEYLHETIQDAKLADRLYEIIFKSNEWTMLDEGTITEEDAFERFCSRCPEIKSSIEQVKGDWHRLLTPITGTVDILREIKKRGYNTYILSNYHLKAFDMIYNKHDFFKLFDGMIISARVNLLKPYPEIFQRLIKEYALLPEETLFIDDTEENIVAARKLGFAVIRFETPEKLVHQLEELNLLR